MPLEVWPRIIASLIEITKGRLPVGGEVVSGVEPFFEKTLKRQRATRVLTNNTRQEKHISTTHRIDVHQRVVPPFWAEALPNHGGDPSGPRSGDPSGTVLPQWSPNSATDLMDSQEIATGILSLTAPGIVGWDQGERREMARRVNEYTADLVAKQPARFGNLATLPLPDVDGALSELEYALDALGADGAILLGNYGEKYLGDVTIPVCGGFLCPSVNAGGKVAYGYRLNKHCRRIWRRNRQRQ